MPYGWLTYAAAKQQLAQRLADPSKVFWTDTELGLNLCAALRTWNALTETWKTTFAFTIAAASNPSWYSLGVMAGSPRLRRLTDVALYTEMQFHLLEPATGGVWGGTSQFSIADFQLALQRCRDEAIQVANCNLVKEKPAATRPGDREIQLDDTILDVARVRWMPVEGAPVTLSRNDATGLNFYQPAYLQAAPGTPTQYVLSTEVPLTVSFDTAPAYPGTYELLALEAGQPFTPPTPTLLNVPDDFAWVLKFGALADVLSRESEATDEPRATYCRKRYSDGLKLMADVPWILQAQVNGVSASLTSVAEMDTYRPEWDTRGPDYQSVVFAGTDFFTAIPDPLQPMSVSLTVLANAPVPTLDTDMVQCSRDVWDSILDYAQFLSMFKQGGAEFQGAMSLEQGFLSAAMLTNDRLKRLGLFADVYSQQAARETREQARFSEKQ